MWRKRLAPYYAELGLDPNAPVPSASRAPFDVILVTAAPEHVPEPLLAQLAVGGRLVIPIGPSDEAQELERWTRLRPGDDKGAFRTETLLPVRFVPFAGERVAR